MTLVLRPLGVGDEDAARAADAELTETRFLVEPVGDLPWATYLQRLADIEAGLVEGRWEGVPEVFRVAEVDGALVGRVAIKPELNAWLAAVGGHIGYAVHPAFRRRGHATEILRQSLAIVRERGVDPALLTCEDTNVGSAAVIEACGGVLESVVWDAEDAVDLRRYWVPTA